MSPKASRRSPLRFSRVADPGCRRITAVTVALALISGLGLFVPSWSPRAQAQCEEDGWIFPYLPQGNTAYGNMGVIQATTNSNMCAGGHVHQTVFIRLYNDYSAWVEVGYDQDSNNNFWVWYAYGDPACPNGECSYGFDLGLTSGQSLSVNVTTSATPSGACESAWSLWYFQYALNGTESNWHYFPGPSHSKSYPRICGMAESEVSWYGSASAWDTHTALKRRPSGGGWQDWPYIACDPNITRGDSTNGFSAHWLSANSWHARNDTTGDCYVA
jgi:hypothetical protein